MFAGLIDWGAALEKLSGRDVRPMLLCAGLGLGVSALVCFAIIRLAGRNVLAARARDPHHTHQVAVSRLGGVALAAAFAATVSFLWLHYAGDPRNMPHRWVFVAGALAMFGLGLADDIRPLGATKKLLGQVMVAVGVYLCGISIQFLKVPVLGAELELGWWSLPVTVLWLVGLTNLINLVDGADGLAGGICLMLMVLLAYLGEAMHMGVLAAGMAGALLGFLYFNFPPARIYMGDGGAYFLGFVIGLMTMVNSHKGTVAAALVAPLFVLALPIVDTTLAILRRGLRGLPIFRPDRRHIHHHLLATGMSRRRMVLGLYLFTLVFLVMGFLAFTSQGRLVPVLMGAAAAILLGVGGWLSFSREWFAVGRVLGNSMEIRREIQYALQLFRWFELEGVRSASGERLFSDFVFILGKLGFSRACLTLPEGEWTWQSPDCASDLRVNRQPIHARFEAVLELGASRCAPEEEAEQDGKRRSAVKQGGCPCAGSSNLFEILCELAAEAWLKAVRRWEKANQCPLRFEGVLADPSCPGEIRKPGRPPVAASAVGPRILTPPTISVSVRKI
jgi:UDP-GlcNAc:undecaprenyl-phosphate/decaprenyl-phosphate GlcNAc-1-phosphate transferase